MVLRMSKILSNIELTDTLILSECNDGWWLYDCTRGMNLAMKAKSQEAAFIKALTYYQNRLQEVERDLKSINNKVNKFVNQFIERDEE